MLDRIYKRMDIVNTMEGITTLEKKWPDAVIKLIEDKANGPAVIQMMRYKTPGLVAEKVSKSKGERVNAVLPLWEGGNVYIPKRIEIDKGVFETCTWAEEVIDLCAGFRPEKKVQKDDDVDAASQALRRFIHVIVYNDVPAGQPSQMNDDEDDDDEITGNWLAG
jgi:predicted phage terminase large subunit-like protein